MSGELKTDDRLPPESELCEQFGVSRTVIREATRSLIDRGLLSSEPGRGTFATAMTPQAFSNSFSLFVKSSGISPSNLIEVRETLEVKIAALAAKRATPEDLERMQQALDKMDRNIEKREAFTTADMAFHRALTEAAHNDIFFALMDFLISELNYFQHVSMASRSGCHLEDQQFHKAVYQHVKAGNSEAAARTMRDHLWEATRDFRDNSRRVIA